MKLIWMSRIVHNVQDLPLGSHKKFAKPFFDELKLTASAGVAPLKFLAKIASDMNKPNGQFVIQPHEVEKFVKTLPLKKNP